MKIIKKLFVMLLLIVGCFATTVSAATIAPSSFTISASKTKMLYGYKILGNGSTLNFTYKVNNDGKIVYCTEIHDSMTSSTETYTLSKEASAEIAYVLANGYPTKSITGNNDTDYYITGLAVWYLLSPNDSTFTYFNLNAGTYKGASSNVVKQVTKLVNEAKGASYTKPTLKLNNPSTNLTLSSDGKYYVSQAMNVSTTGTVGKYTVSLSGAPSGSFVVNSNGSSQTTFASGEEFIVKVPVSSVNSSSVSLKVNVKATGTIDKAYIYAPQNSAHQSLVTLYEEQFELSDSTSLSTSLETKVTISKLDIANDKELPGATLIIKDSEGNVVAEWVSTNESKVITGLPFGTYTLTEKIAPDGYTLSEETITFTLSANKLEASATMYNSKEVVVVISKLDITNDEELPGAHLILKDKDGNVIEEWVSGDEPHKIKDLEPGEKYVLTETIAPEGYELSKESIEFTVNEDGSVTTVVMYNSPKDVTKVIISKQDISSGKELKGAHLVLKDKDGNVIEEWVSGDKPHEIEGLVPGEKYTLTETLQPDGYILNEESIEFTVNEDGSVTTVVMYNAPSEVIKEVPKTASFKTMAYSLIGIIVIGLGSLLIIKNVKENEC